MGLELVASVASVAAVPAIRDLCQNPSRIGVRLSDDDHPPPRQCFAVALVLTLALCSVLAARVPPSLIELAEMMCSSRLAYGSLYHVFETSASGS